MKTGEGKTLVATFPAYLNALTGRGVHVVTVNDYLAKRDADWMSNVFTALGMTTGVVYRIRVRLFARQHARQHRGNGPTRPSFCNRRRGGQHFGR